MRQKIRQCIIFALPAVLFYSFYPYLLLGANDSMNFELTLPLLFLAGFALLSLPEFIIFLKKSDKTRLLALVFPLYLSLSVLWSKNQLRGLLTVALVWVLLISIVTIKSAIKNRKILEKIIVVSGLVFAGFCFLQSLLDLIGVSEDITLLCQGCTIKTFGFPHPNGFAIEPQFMGNLLLFPALFMLNSLLQNKTEKSQTTLKVAGTCFAVAMLFFTFSRGAIYAFILASMLLLFFYRKNLTTVIKGATIIVSAFLISLNLQGLFTLSNKTNDTYFDGISRSISQLTLGKIELRDEKPDEINSEFEEPPIEETIKTTFDGYIAESTDRRVELFSYAIDIWNDGFKNLSLGVGVGGAGEAMFEKFPAQGTAKEIVQNQYFEILLEAGLVGVFLFTVSICALIKSLKFEKLTVCLLFAYAITLFFFSGLPNALHIYILPVLCYNIMYENKNRLS